MPRPFGVWAPATTLAELKARCPRPGQFSLKYIFYARHEVFYPPEAMAHFKNPQQFKDAVDTVRAMSRSNRIFGDGLKLPHRHWSKLSVIVFGTWAAVYLSLYQFYSVYIPANNPTWRKIVNKEWEEALNNSPWDHMTHVWQYSDVYATVLGEAAVAGQRKFYIPA